MSFLVHILAAMPLLSVFSTGFWASFPVFPKNLHDFPICLIDLVSYRLIFSFPVLAFLSQRCQVSTYLLGAYEVSGPYNVETLFSDICMAGFFGFTFFFFLRLYNSSEFFPFFVNCLKISFTYERKCKRSLKEKPRSSLLLSREHSAGLNPRTFGSWPEPKAGT